jgi:hypothetical protein
MPMKRKSSEENFAKHNKRLKDYRSNSKNLPERGCYIEDTSCFLQTHNFAGEPKYRDNFNNNLFKSFI